MRTILLTSVIGLSLALGGCDKGDAEKKDTKTAAKGKADAKGKAGDAKGKAGDAKAGDAEAKTAEAEDVFDDRVVKAAGLAKKIEADPEKADEILAEAGMDRAAFEALIYEVSTPELAEQYRLALARES